MRPPDLANVARAWRIERTPAVVQAHVREFGYEDSGIDCWIINGPYHPAWSWWYVAIVHLRDVPGAPPAHKRYPAAEYELMILSIDPACYVAGAHDLEALELDRPAATPLKLLQPPDLIFQFDGLDDTEARSLGARVAQVIVDGQSCDSDYRRWWLGALQLTVELVKAGFH